MSQIATHLESAEAKECSPVAFEHRQGMPAWLLSVVLHASIFVAIGLMAPAVRRTSSNEGERIVGIALVERSATNEVEYFSEGNSAVNSNAVPAANSAEPPSPPRVEDLRIDFATKLPSGSQGNLATGGSIAVPSAAGLTAGSTGSKQGQVGGKTRTQIFGAQGDGSEFVYVFDRSASMAAFGGRPLAAAKAELQRSLNDLVSVNQFQIVFYNEQPTIFNPFRPNPPKMFFGTEENKQLASQHIQSITPVGGTRHKEALEFALRMGPDVIFFLTDAAEPELTARELADIRRRNRSESIINTIEFGIGPFSGGENFLTRLAKQNSGQYVYVDVTALARTR